MKDSSSVLRRGAIVPPDAAMEPPVAALLREAGGIGPVWLLDASERFEHALAQCPPSAVALRFGSAECTGGRLFLLVLQCGAVQFRVVGTSGPRLEKVLPLMLATRKVRLAISGSRFNKLSVLTCQLTAAALAPLERAVVPALRNPAYLKLAQHEMGHRCLALGEVPSLVPGGDVEHADVCILVEPELARGSRDVKKH